ncbi:MAG: cytidylate kinase-like family protein [Pseudobutyrivibrio sp.]|nr:cytidylate kinase-like family protein [Pseudobutyrivibrio sp.]
MYEYITIERKYGSGGHKIADTLAKKLNYKLYDRGVVVETCKRIGLPYDQVSAMDEQTPVKAIFKMPGADNVSMEEKIYNTEAEIIREAAEQPGCIFVGRCASEILKDKKCLRVFITASDSYRLNRSVNVEKNAPDKAEEVMKRFDKKREKFFTTHSGAKWGDPEYFDLVLNSDKLGEEACIAILETLAKL